MREAGRRIGTGFSEPSGTETGTRPVQEETEGKETRAGAGLRVGAGTGTGSRKEVKLLCPESGKPSRTDTGTRSRPRRKRGRSGDRNRILRALQG